MKRVTVGGLTRARSANLATLSSPAIGYEASSTLASFRSAGLRLSSRWRTSSPTLESWPATFVTSRLMESLEEPSLTKILSPVSFPAKPCSRARLPAASEGREGPRMSVQAKESDVELLHKMGYAQELRRRMSTVSNVAVSFTIISILSGCLTLYGYGMNTGGPIDMNIGWPLVGLFVILVGLAMAEVCSSYPTAGGLYYWAAKLGGKNSAAWSWFTGWFNLLGQVGVTAGIDFGLALFADALLNALFQYPTTPIWIVLIYAVVLFLHGLLNTFGVGLVALLNDISGWWHLIGVAVIFIVVFLSGLLLAQYTCTGYDASAHMTEETNNAALAGPRGIVWSIVVSLIAGWVLLIGVTSAIVPANYAGEFAAGGAAPGVIFLDSLGKGWTTFLLLIVVGAQFYCGMSSV